VSLIIIRPFVPIISNFKASVHMENKSSVYGLLMNYTSGQDIAAATMQIEASDQNQFGQVRIQCTNHINK
jgi:hypothetical protein